MSARAWHRRRGKAERRLWLAPGPSWGSHAFGTCGARCPWCEIERRALADNGPYVK